MLHQVRIRLADRPGSLGRVTWTLGALGVDIRQMVVLGRESGRAVDDITVELPGSVSRERLTSTLEEIPGVAVEGVWPAGMPGASSDAAVVGQVAADPERGLATLIDAAPRLLGADWAVLVDADGSVAYGSVGAPSEVRLSTPLRARSYESGGHWYAMAPLGTGAAPAMVAVTPPLAAAAPPMVAVARADAPAFHRAELDRLIQLVDTVATILSSHPVPT